MTDAVERDTMFIVDPLRVSEAMEDGRCFWRGCSGCHELNDGAPTGAYSKALRCHIGVGCFECGGIGAIWDTTDYADMGDWLAKQEESPAAEKAPLYTRPQSVKEVVEALRGMLAHSCVADAGGDMKTEEDHEAERRARAALASLSQEQG